LIELFYTLRQLAWIYVVALPGMVIEEVCNLLAEYADRVRDGFSKVPCESYYGRLRDYQLSL